MRQLKKRLSNFHGLSSLPISVAIGPDGQVWGPVTRRLADAYQRFVGHDFVAQYLKRYTEGMEARAF